MKIAYVPQDPAAALNPAIRIGRQIVELLELRGIGTAEERLEGPAPGCARSASPTTTSSSRRYPHQLSGGQVQRVALAMAFLPRPKVLVLDEPTTGLDVTTQGMVLQTMGELCRSHRVAALYVTHDLAVVANIADRVAVMYAGQIIELGPREAMFRQPAHPYTRALLDAIPHLSPGPRAHRHPRLDAGARARARPGAGSTTAASTPRTRCRGDRARATSRSARTTRQVRCVRVGEIGTWDIYRGNTTDTDPHTPRDIILTIDDLKVFYGRKEVVHGVSFDVAKAEVVALVGESGSGKTTISRCVGGLHKQWTGELTFEGRPLGKGARARSAEDRKRIQYIFQNPYLSLNPRLTIQQIVKRPMELFGIAKGKAARDRVVELLDAVALGPTVLDLQTNRLSGGERQRVAIARALAAEPDLLVCDEITSALDVSVQGSIVALLEDLRKTRRISMLFVTHNLALVRSIAGAGADAQRGRAGRVRLRGGGAGHAQGGLHQAAARQLSPRSTDARMPPAVGRPFVNPQLGEDSAWTYRARWRRTDPRPLPVPTGAIRGSRSSAPADAGPRRVARRHARHGAAGARRRACSCTSGTPTGSARATCSSAPRRPSRCWRTWSACGRTAPGPRRPGRRARAGAGGQRLRAGAGARRAQHDQRRGLGGGPPRPGRPGHRARRGVRRRAARRGRCWPGSGRATRPAPATSTARPTPRCSTGCANAPPASAFRDALGELWRDLGCTDGRRWSPSTATGWRMAGGGLAAAAGDWARVGPAPDRRRPGTWCSTGWVPRPPSLPFLRPGRLPAPLSHARRVRLPLVAARRRAAPAWPPTAAAASSSTSTAPGARSS